MPTCNASQLRVTIATSGDSYLQREKVHFWLLISMVLVHEQLTLLLGLLVRQYFMVGTHGRANLLPDGK